MAEVTGLRNNALPYPIYGVRFGIVVALLDADGDPVTGASSPDSEVSKNGDTFADCTNEATEIATSSGSYYLLLTDAEMTADIVTVQIKTGSTKTQVITLYPRKLVSVRASTSASGGASTSTIVLDASASAIDDFYNGMVCVAIIDTLTEVRMISDYTGSTQTATVVPDWNVAPDNNDTFTVYLPDGYASFVHPIKIYSDTTNIDSITSDIQSDTNVIITKLGEGDTSDILSRLVVTNSQLVVVKSDAAHCESKVVQIYSDTTHIDLLTGEGDFSDILSRLTVTNSQVLIIKSDTSDIRSHIALWEGAAGLISDMASGIDVIQSVTSDIQSDTNVMVPIISDIQSDTNKLVSDASEVDTSDILSMLTAVQAVVSDIQSDTNVLLTKVGEGDWSDILSRLVVTNSQLVVIKSDVNHIESDAVVIETVTSDIQSDTNVLITKLGEGDFSDIISLATKIYSDTTAIPTAIENADALLNRDMSTGTDSGSTTVRTVRQALRFLRNKWTNSGGTLTVYKEDDSTSSWTGATATTASDPVTSVDPAGP